MKTVVDNIWQETTKDNFDEMLRCLPPAIHKPHSFAVGEPYTHTGKGPVHQAFCEVNGRYFKRLAYLRKYDEAEFVSEITKQFFGGGDSSTSSNDMTADQIVKEIEDRCSNTLETQSSIAQSYANMIRRLDIMSDEQIKAANAAVKSRYPSKSGLARVKKMAWGIVEKHR